MKTLRVNLLDVVVKQQAFKIVALTERTFSQLHEVIRRSKICALQMSALKEGVIFYGTNVLKKS